MTFHCRECLAEIPPTARDGRCSLCRPSRRHSEQATERNRQYRQESYQRRTA